MRWRLVWGHACFGHAQWGKPFPPRGAGGGTRSAVRGQSMWRRCRCNLPVLGMLFACMCHMQFGISHALCTEGCCAHACVVRCVCAILKSEGRGIHAVYHARAKAAPTFYVHPCLLLLFCYPLWNQHPTRYVIVPPPPVSSATPKTHANLLNVYWASASSTLCPRCFPNI